jgi:hypothetical protein
MNEHSYILLGKATPATGHGGPTGSEMSRLPNFLDSLLTGGG